MTDAWRATALTIFPDLFPGPLEASVTGRGLARGLWSIETVDIREYAEPPHRKVDDTPLGGGAGMVMRPDVLAAAVDGAIGSHDPRPRIALTPRGAPFDQMRAREWAAGPGLVLLCGRFEGIDQRLIDSRGFVEISVGDYVLSGGEIAAMAILDACARLLPGVVGNEASLERESFDDGLLEHPHYTRPRVFEGRAAPDVLLSGHHENIEAWRRDQARALTAERRPDLLGFAATTHGGPPAAAPLPEGAS